MPIPNSELDRDGRALMAEIEALRRELASIQGRVDAIASKLGPTHPDARTSASIDLGAAGNVPADRGVSSGMREPLSKPFDVHEWLRHAARGTAVFVPDPQAADHPIVLLVRADSERISELDAAPKTEFRAGLFHQPDSPIVVIPVLVRIGPLEGDNVFEAWIDEFSKDTGHVLAPLAAQANLTIHLYGDDCHCDRSLTVANPLHGLAREALAMIGAAEPWSTVAYGHARRAVYEQYTTLRSLWGRLKR